MWKRTPIGVDIGASGARIAQLMRSGNLTTPNAVHYAVTSSALSELNRPGQAGQVENLTRGSAGLQPAAHEPAESHGDAENTGDPDVRRETDVRAARCVRNCLRKAEFRGGGARAALNSPAVEFHALELPPEILEHRGPADKSHSSDVASLVKWEVARLRNELAGSAQANPLRGLPSPAEARYWVLPPAQVSAPNVIAVTVRGDAVVLTLRTCADAGLQCTCVDAGALAAARFAGLLNNWNADQVWGVLDVGYSEARVVLCVDNVPVLVRRASSGGRGWTERIAESLQLSTTAAEVQKREHGIALTGRGVRRGSEMPPGHEKGGMPKPKARACVASILHSVLRGELNDLASQIKRSYEYVLSCYPRHHATDLVLIGGGATMRNLPEFLSAALGIPVRQSSDYLGRPSCRLSYEAPGEHRLESIALAVGIAAT
jgi:Tfp pilus assembly PilM family ATPase